MNCADLQLFISPPLPDCYPVIFFGHVTFRFSTKWPTNLAEKIAYYVIGWVISIKSLGGKWLRHGLYRYAK